MGVSASWIRADWRQHDDAWPGAAVFHAPLEFDGRPGGAVFFDTIFREVSGQGGDPLAFSAHGVFEGDQRPGFLVWFGVCLAWTLVVGGLARNITACAVDFAGAALLPLCWD